MGRTDGSPGQALRSGSQSASRRRRIYLQDSETLQGDVRLSTGSTGRPRPDCFTMTSHRKTSQDLSGQSFMNKMALGGGAEFVLKSCWTTMMLWVCWLDIWGGCRAPLFGVTLYESEWRAFFPATSIGSAPEKSRMPGLAPFRKSTSTVLLSSLTAA